MNMELFKKQAKLDPAITIHDAKNQTINVV